MAVNTPVNEEEKEEESQLNVESQEQPQESHHGGFQNVFSASHIFAGPNETREKILEAHKIPGKLKDAKFRKEVEHALSLTEGRLNSFLIGPKAREVKKSVAQNCKKYAEIAKVEAEKKAQGGKPAATDQKKELTAVT